MHLAPNTYSNDTRLQVLPVKYSTLVSQIAQYAYLNLFTVRYTNPEYALWTGNRIMYESTHIISSRENQHFRHYNQRPTSLFYKACTTEVCGFKVTSDSMKIKDQY